jgi:hypothetical protein
MAAQGRVGAAVLAAMLLATMAVTVVIAWLVVPPELRGDRFMLNLGFILFAEVATFAWPIYEAQRDLTRQATFPFNLGMGSLIGVYDVGVLLIAALSSAGIAWLWLVSAHVLWLLALALFAGIWFLGSRHVQQQSTSTRGVNDFHQGIRTRFLALAGSLEAGGQLPRPVRHALAELGDDIQHAQPGSTAAATDVEGRIAAGFESLAAACRQAAGSEETSAPAAKALEEIRTLRSLFGERGALVKHRV